jgi:2-keto-4-pentenoate hydratase
MGEIAMANVVNDAAERIWSVYRSRVPCTPVRDVIGAADVEVAYAVQETNTVRWLKEGRKLSGRKIGLTSKAVQQQLGVDQPDFGMLFADMLFVNGAPISAARFMQPRVEAEIALVLSKSLDRESHSMEDIANATDYAVAAIEIVDSRIAKWDIRLADTVADNASSGGYVLGSERKKLVDIDLVGCQMAMERRREVISRGSGAACLGNPLNAAAWLADTMAKRGRPLGAGDVVLTGALGPMVAVAPGDDVTANIEGIGTVRARFEMDLA